jgi:tRNA-Thr(GGU) m(6)t(6)A37 methyltransferase TsaA
MNENPRFELQCVGRVESTLLNPEEAPPQGDEGAPEAWIVLRPEFSRAMRGLCVGDPVVVLTWLDRANRDVLEVHPRGDTRRPLHGVFSTRSPHRPNPVGLHEVRVLAIEENRIQVSSLEAIDGTPVIDLKPVLGTKETR